MKQIQRTLSAIHDVELSLKAQLPDWREQLFGWAASIKQASKIQWVTVRPHIDSSGGQKHSLLEDGSILAAGYAPSRETSKFTVEVKAKRITAIRLELLTHPDLQRNGPGRSPSGSAALSEMRVRAACLDQTTHKSKTLQFARAMSDARVHRRKAEGG